MTLHALLTAKTIAVADGSKAAAKAELESIFSPEEWGLEFDVNAYTNENIQNLWNNELRRPVRRLLEANAKTTDDFKQWLGEIQFVNLAIYSRKLFDRYRNNAGWRVTVFSLPRADAVVVALSSHYQNAQNHNKLGEASNLLYDVIAEAALDTLESSFVGRKISAADWDHAGFIDPRITLVAGVDIAPYELWLKDIRTTTVKKTLASFITLAVVPATELSGTASSLVARLQELKSLAEHLIANVYPFSTVEEFEAFRALALQDTVAARSRLLLRSSTGTRSSMRIYYGPPGTGKTLAAVRFAVSLADAGYSSEADNKEVFDRFNELSDQCAFVTFHPSLQYEDLVESIRPNIIANSIGDSADGDASRDGDDAATGDAESGAHAAGTSLSYRLHEGPLLRLIRRALLSPSKEHVIVVDEINRGDISRILGPLISSLDIDKRLGAKYPIGVELMYPRAAEAESRLFLPSNLHVIGTMNSADRNIALVDHALRRRFEFIEVPPSAELLSGANDVQTIDCKRLLSTINRRIEHLLDADHCVGHGYLMSCKSDSEIVASFAKNIIPLLKEYFYGNEGLVRLLLSETLPGAPKIFASNTDAAEFSSIFGVDYDAAVDLGYRPGTGSQILRIDERFWTTNGLVGTPGDISYAAASLRKIYQWPEPASVAAVAPSADV